MAFIDYIHGAEPWKGENEPQRETPQETDIWFKPFAQAVTTGLVDGRKTQGSRIITGGLVSENPHSDSRAAGS